MLQLMCVSVYLCVFSVARFFYAVVVVVVVAVINIVTKRKLLKQCIKSDTI